MPAGRGSDGQGGRPAVDREEAFAFWAGLPEASRSYRAVAAEFGISPRTVERYGREGAWTERLRRIEEHARAEADERLGQERVERLATVKKLIDATFVSYAQQLASGNVRHTPSGFVTVVKLLLEQLDEQPAENNKAAEKAGPPHRSFEHKLAVLRVLREAGMFALLDQVLDPESDQESEVEGEELAT